MNEFILVAIKLLIGFFALTIIINVTGKGNLAPSSASDQVQNYVLGGILSAALFITMILRFWTMLGFCAYGACWC